MNAAGCSCLDLVANIDDNDDCTVDACASGLITNTFVDTDGDLVCDFDDDCDFLPNLNPGDPCPCANPCDINCAVTAGCNCLGTYTGDTDGDGLCDALDNCPLIPGQIGSPCTDPEPCNRDAFLDANCECHGAYSGDTDDDGVCDALDTDWEQRPSMSFGRANAVSFAIGDSGYIATGQNESGFLNDLWRYYPGDGSWSQKADVPGLPRTSAVGFAIGNRGYIGTGEDNSGILNEEWLEDFHEYDPILNIWTQKADLGAGSGVPALARRRSAVLPSGGRRATCPPTGRLFCRFAP